ncbi:putative endoplasmic reticulum mannosyl-oligosaccharide 1,2-alpha-mannosidase [Microthyrium microscopicum]|uniref:alpha-1,2-Mannosidase n=1 Tax=Microthyrium microscopicum TaxID=703497 RepID=A0A6A6TXM1_9PEZI|nr:putative endoplasmic reticulum mannosyl-oligosaccharide 1,2-alpha-mannosidase [Microthyrium microscopicum]
MKASHSRLALAITLSFAIVSLSYHPKSPGPYTLKERFKWSNVPTRYPVTSMIPLPSAIPHSIPKIQATFPTETSTHRQERLAKLEAVKSNFTHAWSGYKSKAWLKDEVAPLSGQALNPFGGWAATLVDALDTLWIMDMKEDFEEAVAAIDKIDFTTCALDEINVFETTIRYLGGFMAAYDLSGGQYPALLKKAAEMGSMLYKAFDTPNRMPITRWKFKDAVENVPQEAPDGILLAEIGSLTLEFTRLSQLTGDTKYYDAVQRIMSIFEDQQNKTKLPGMWPIQVNAKTEDFTGSQMFTIGGMADSAYEYLPKQYLLLNGGATQYKQMYESTLTTMKNHIFFRPMTIDGKDILFAGQVNSNGQVISATDPQAQHLGCFAGGMVALAAKAFNSEADLEVGKKLMEGCLWAYESMRGGIMPEIIHTLPCPDKLQVKCDWDQAKWVSAMTEKYGTTDVTSAEEQLQNLGLPHGIMTVDDSRYILRPEAIESVFILYRITGNATLQDRAWDMFNTIISKTKTSIAHAALNDCNAINPTKADRMESFWLAETLKYFYLIFSEPDLVSLDDYVLNTEAHPLKRTS